MRTKSRPRKEFDERQEFLFLLLPRHRPNLIPSLQFLREDHRDAPSHISEKRRAQILF